MALYAIGDVQGCCEQLQRLLDKLAFDPNRDRLWFTGDLVNRGPESLGVLRLVKALGDAAITVLGNHDLHLLAAAAGNRRHNPDDTIDDVLVAPDREELLHWLRHGAVLYHDQLTNYTLIHAGLPPQWDLSTAKGCANELERVLRGPNHVEYFMHMYGNQPNQWSEGLSGWDRLRFITNCFTRLRYCDPAGHLLLKEYGPPGAQPKPFLPWFKIPQRASKDMNIIFGHWASLGFHTAPGIIALDTGCLWGGQLTALCLDSAPKRISIPCPMARRIS